MDRLWDVKNVGLHEAMRRACSARDINVCVCVYVYIYIYIT
jgi:hypothetical protein